MKITRRESLLSTLAACVAGFTNIRLFSSTPVADALERAMRRGDVIAGQTFAIERMIVIPPDCLPFVLRDCDIVPAASFTDRSLIHICGDAPWLIKNCRFRMQS